MAVDSALAGKPGVIGQDEDNGNVMSTIDFPRIKGGKPFDITRDFFVELLEELGQPLAAAK